MRKRTRLFWLALFLVAASAFIYWKWIPNFTHSSLFAEKKGSIVHRGHILSEQTEDVNGQTMIPLSAIQESIDPYAFGESDGSMTLVGDQNQILHLDVQKAPLETVSTLYSTPLSKNPANDVLYIPDPQANMGSVLSDVAMRSESSIRGKIVHELAKDQQVEILHEEDQWSFVQSQSGEFGFIPSKKVKSVIRNTSQEEVQSSPDRITVVWDQGGYPATAALSGIDAVSPVWFVLRDAEGNIDTSKASKAYVDDAHRRNIKVWGLFNNDFKPEMTHNALSTFEKRQHMIRTLLQAVDTYHLDGINLDFENVFLKDKAVYAQFVRELAANLHVKEKHLSVDVTPKSTSETWSMFLDRKAIGLFADHVMLMAYDQTPEASTIAGSVGSLPWTEESISALLDDVEPHKVILSIPLYTRVWKGEDEVKGSTLSYRYTSSWLNERGFKPVLDPDSGQNFIDTKDASGSRIRVWLEDEHSMKKRFELADKYGLAGIAAWSRNHADEQTWATFLDIDKNIGE